MQNSTKQTTKSRQTDREQQIEQEAFLIETSIIFILSALIGAWALTCLLSGISQHGAIEMIKIWMAAFMDSH
ncbi:MAG: hypothetical protein KKC76_12785 [Proteobacteria bacterium]|nr:hypothetical protein [Pseudomonadota bacterium]MBU4295011.1 hypothetical protein [Pseudomonadota bacterium]MCG2746638.1 hypothetical protein [Desulfobulbaceae bacterium]